jgi:hypothetical protein
MANKWDALIKLLYPADAGTVFTADTVKLDDPFDVLGDIEIGGNLMEFVKKHTLIVSVRNLSKSTTITQKTLDEPLVEQSTAFNKALRVQFPSGWGAQAAVGDVLEAVASYEVQAGLHTDYSIATSAQFVVVDI